MKKVFIFHGTGSSSADFWFPYIKNSLDQKEYQVIIPNLPNTDNPVLEECLNYTESLEFDSETILIGHSSWCPLILSLLERRKECVARTIFVAWFSRQLWEETNPILQEQYQWENISTKSKEFYFINSLNDPWWCNENEGNNFQKYLWGTLILPSKEGHMGSTSFNQPYREFPLLKSLIELPFSL